MSGSGVQFDSDFDSGAGPRPKHRTRHTKKMERFGPVTVGAPFRHVALQAEVTVRSRVMPTEERARVEGAVRALFPDVQFDPAGGEGALLGRAHDLRRLAEVIRSSRIRDAAREALKDSLRPDGTIRFELNKQAAAAGHVNFSLRGREVLGSLSVLVEAEHPLALVEELTWIEGESDERLVGPRPARPARPARHGALR